jgi:hypothetical protein
VISGFAGILASGLAVRAQEQSKEELKLQLPKPMLIGTPRNINSPNLEKITGKSRGAFFVPAGTKLVSLNKPVTASDIPTQGYFMAALGILKIPWEKWVRWLLPLLLIWLALGMAAVVIAQAIHLGPF